MASLEITQEPMYKMNATGQPLVYTLRAEDTVLNETNVKFICQIWGGRNTNDFYKISTLKTTPNGAGVGIFDISSIIDSYVGPTYQGKRGMDDEHPNAVSKFKGVWWNRNKPHTIHQIDKYCTNTKNMFLYEVYFYIEYMDQVTGMIVEDDNQGDYRGGNLVYNGVVGHHLNLTSNSLVADDFARFGRNIQDFNYSDGTGDYLIRDTFGSGASYTEGGKFVTNMPMRGQTMRATDYGTVAFFNCIDSRNAISSGWNHLGNFATCPTAGGYGENNIPGIALRFKDAMGVVVANFYYPNEPMNGGAMQNTSSEDSAVNMVYFGHGLANHLGRGDTYPASACNYDVYPSDGTNFCSGEEPGGGEPGGGGGEEGGGDGEEEEHGSGGHGYKVPPKCDCRPCEEPPRKWKCTTDGIDGDCIYDTEKECIDANRDDPPEPPLCWYTPIGRIYNFSIIHDDCHGYESVRLVWLNAMGAWDYYTFTKKSTKKVKTKGITYNQLGGTWNEAIMSPYDHLGGDKIFINQSKTSYDLNTDYISEDIAKWFEEMFTTSDMYILEGWDEDEPVPNFGGAANPPNYLRKYLIPVTVGAKKYTKKTRANDTLIKYKFSVDLTIPTNIQKA